jgi:c(7)-type cytochrome triheme protein
MPGRARGVRALRASMAAAVLLAAAAALAAAYPATLRIPRREAGRAPAVPEAMVSHRSHDALGCFACHPGTFPQAAFGFTHEDMNNGRFCGRCHDGRVSFAVVGTACARCHVPTR